MYLFICVVSSTNVVQSSFQKNRKQEFITVYVKK